MSDKRFSYVVERYFRKRGTYPVTLMFRNRQVDDSFLVSIDDEVHERFGGRDDISIVTSRIVEGDFWSGVLVEFSDDEFRSVDAENVNVFCEDDVTLHQQLSSLYRELDECDTYITGFSCGSSVYAVASLESLGESYFKTVDEVRRGPSIE